MSSPLNLDKVLNRDFIKEVEGHNEILKNPRLNEHLEPHVQAAIDVFKDSESSNRLGNRYGFGTPIDDTLIQSLVERLKYIVEQFDAEDGEPGEFIARSCAECFQGITHRIGGRFPGTRRRRRGRYVGLPPLRVQ